MSPKHSLIIVTNWHDDSEVILIVEGSQSSGGFLMNLSPTIELPHFVHAAFPFGAILARDPPNLNLNLTPNLNVHDHVPRVSRSRHMKLSALT